MRPKSFVDATWRMPLHKVVIAQWLLDIGNDLGVSDVTYIPNAIDHDRYKCIMPLHDRPRQIAMLFSAVPLKGAKNGVRALEIVRRSHPDLKVVFFGAGRRQSWVPEWITYYRNPPQSFIVEQIYNRSSIFLSPSWSEGFPLPPAEAACCGCAIVAAENGGIREYVDHGISGLLSPPKDASGLAANLGSLLEDDGLRIRLATAAGTVIRRFNWEHSTNLLENFIEVSQRVSQRLELVGVQK
ncbi:MAG: glycosyltransferase family 4 protein [Candidatus Acidiferrales bacterium]